MICSSCKWEDGSPIVHRYSKVPCAKNRKPHVDLIGDDHVPRFVKRGPKLAQLDSALEDEETFARLQNLGHHENSEDFSDSPFADRR